MGKLSVFVPHATPWSGQALPFAAFTRQSGAHRLWQGQSMTCDPHQTFTYVAGRGYRLPVGIGVSLMPFRHPLGAALEASHLATTMEHPVVAGYGAGWAALQHMLLGRAYGSQIGAAREYLVIMKSLLDEGKADCAGEYFTCHAELPSLSRPPVEVGLGVLRPGAARLAGEVADVAVAWLAPAAYLRDVILPSMAAGAAAARRPVPRLVAIVPFALSGPGRDASDMALASSAAHMLLPHYVDMLRRSGIAVDMRDPRASGAALAAGDAFLFGDAGDIVSKLSHYWRAGVDEIVLNPTGVFLKEGLRSALNELETIVSATPA
ncbi:LLM class flavin-dependent oxidoreductase [Microbispora sp. NPDC088329]|uniref:LLM class flavin-dependent oxidoreductase n=1 Tax=Microbispora sp. NPDC088329 TaxID=3154869 RepID=UPI00342F0559